jgi:hypothetical protein
MANLPPIPPATDRLLLKPREAAYLLGFSVSALYKRVEDGVIPHHWGEPEWHSVRLQVFAASRLDAMYDVLLS